MARVPLPVWLIGLLLGCSLCSTLPHGAAAWDRPLSDRDQRRIRDIIRESDDLTGSERAYLRELLREEKPDEDRRTLERIERNYQDQEEQEDAK
jgi:hypothetical protein